MLKFVKRRVHPGLRLHFFVLMLLFLMLNLIPVAATGVTLSAGDGEIILGITGPDFSKSFSPATIGPGSTTTLRFVINNGSPGPVSALAFTDTMPAEIVIATPANATNSCDGTLAAPDGGSSISLNDGDVGGNSSCTVTVDVTSSTIGIHTNTSGALTSSAGTGDSPSADLTVDETLPGFSKSFSPNTVDLGGRSTLTFTIDNTANEGSVESLNFTDNFPTGMEIADPANAFTTCGIDPFVPNITAVPGTAIFSFTLGGFLPNFPALAGGATCVVSVDVVTTGIGELINSSGELLIDFSDSSGKANAALDSSFNTLYLTKSFVNDPVPAGGEVDLVFTIMNQDRFNSATNVSFTDDLDATLTGLTATGLPQNNTCGSGTLSGTGLISLSGGNLPPSGSCTFSVTLQIPANAATGSYPNITSDVTATVAGNPVVGSAGADTLFIAPVPLLTKTFIGDPVAAGDDVILRFNITNSSATSTATDVAFIDELTTFLPYPVSVVLPTTPCGTGSVITLDVINTDTHALSLTGGELAANASCSFDVTVTIPVGLGSGSYLNTTSNVTATIDGNTVEGHPASDTLDVVSAPTLRKTFIDDPVLGGEMVTLEFTIEHGIEEPGDATNIAFTDDLDAVLTGLVAVGLPQNDVCGSGSQISGTDILSFTGGNVAAGDGCIFSVQLQLPSGDFLPGKLPNITSNITADVLGLPVTGLPAEDDLIIGGLNFWKRFIGEPVLPGDTVILEFIIENESTTESATAMSFTDDLEATISGLVVIPPLPNEPCGTGSAISGTSLLTFTGGNLAQDNSCTFRVTLQVPSSISFGAYQNTTSNLGATINAVNVTVAPAQDNLNIGFPLLYIPYVIKEASIAPDLVGSSLFVKGGNVQIESQIRGERP